MLQIHTQKWNQTPEFLRLFALETPHIRTRERFLALYDISQGHSATAVAARLGREDATVQRWVHLYNERGPEALAYRRSGGRPPFVRSSARPSQNC